MNLRVFLSEFVSPEAAGDSIIIALRAHPDIRDGRLGALDRAVGGAVGAAITGGDFKGRLKQTLVLHNLKEKGPRRVILAGLGDPEEQADEQVRRVLAAAYRTAVGLPIKSVSVDIGSLTAAGLSATRAAGLAAETARMTIWRNAAYRTQLKEEETWTLESVELLWPESGPPAEAKEAVYRGDVSAAATCYARELVGRPANELYPETLAEEARSVAKRHGFGLEVFAQDDLGRMGMNALLAVGAGSSRPPFLVVIDSAPGSQEKPALLVGKGLTFDSGGISIKAASGMEKQKGDMAGAAAVIGAADALGRLKTARRTIFVIPAAENLPGPSAQRPGDIWKSHSGLTIEIISTDAEGRLVLADALSYAVQRYQPEFVIDVATLTRACIVALGSVVCGLMGNDDPLCDALFQAGEKTGERVWRLPLYKDYDELLKSDLADVRNSGENVPGAIMGGMFLKRFVGETPWAHLDIAGTSWLEKPRDYIPAGPTGFGVRLLVETVSGRK
jgi:leucyl aminopeptidase